MVVVLRTLLPSSPLSRSLARHTESHRIQGERYGKLFFIYK